MTRALLLAAVMLAQLAAQPRVFTAAQAAAGKAAYDNSCGNCHTHTLAGRTGAPGELPTLDAIPAHMSKMVAAYKGQIPPLTGQPFLAKWATVQALALRIKEAVGGFPPKDKTDESFLELTAFILQVAGAKPGDQPLTANTVVPLHLVLPPTRK